MSGASQQDETKITADSKTMNLSDMFGHCFASRGFCCAWNSFKKNKFGPFLWVAPISDASSCKMQSIYNDTGTDL